MRWWSRAGLWWPQAFEETSTSPPIIDAVLGEGVESCVIIIIVIIIKKKALTISLQQKVLPSFKYFCES